MNAVPPPPPPAPSRTIAIACNCALVLLMATSFGACSKYGCSSRHLSDDVAVPLAIMGAALSAAMGAAAIAIFVKAARTKSMGPSVLGLIVSIMLTLASVVLTPFFWLCAASASSGIGFGGWGRPLRVGFRKRAVTPGVRASTEWANGPRPEVRDLTADARALLRDLWLHDARKEHASVPAFGRVAWQLVALGAPSDLIRRAHQSSIQEIDHAERCFTLASAYAGEDLGVQAMPELLTASAALPGDLGKALEQVATEALIDGALLEDYNAELAATALPDVTDPAAREALVRVVEDERDHARLAWDIVAFCVERGGAPVEKALRKAFAGIAADPVSLYETDLAARVAAFAEPAILAAHGRVRADVIAPVFRDRKAYAAARLAAILDGERKVQPQPAVAA